MTAWADWELSGWVQRITYLDYYGDIYPDSYVNLWCKSPDWLVNFAFFETAVVDFNFNSFIEQACCENPANKLPDFFSLLLINRFTVSDNQWKSLIQCIQFQKNMEKKTKQEKHKNPPVCWRCSLLYGIQHVKRKKGTQGILDFKT